VFAEIGWDSAVARGKILIAYGLLTGDLTPDASVLERIYQCTTCKRCETKCPSKVEVINVIESGRKDLVRNDYIIEAHRRIMESILTHGNPFEDTRARHSIFNETVKRAEVGYFTGCVSAFRLNNIAEATISIFKKLGVDYTLINETCCGSPLRRIGANDGSFEKLMDKNLSKIHELEVEKVVFSCAGCFRMFAQEYASMRSLDFAVEHVSMFLSRLDFELQEFPQSAAYHDPCHLGRHTGIYAEPRELIKRIPGMDLRELEYAKEDARCCGAGGGVRAAFPELALKLATQRLQEVRATGTSLLLTACPFCNLNFRDNEEGVEVKDIVELIDTLLVV
jgi:Fe-S oxidoreductase